MIIKVKRAKEPQKNFSKITLFLILLSFCELFFSLLWLDKNFFIITSLIKILNVQTLVTLIKTQGILLNQTITMILYVVGTLFIIFAIIMIFKEKDLECDVKGLSGLFVTLLLTVCFNFIHVMQNIENVFYNQWNQENKLKAQHEEKSTKFRKTKIILLKLSLATLILPSGFVFYLRSKGNAKKACIIEKLIIVCGYLG